MEKILALELLSVYLDVNTALSQFGSVEPSDSASVQRVFDNLQKNLVTAVQSGLFTTSLAAASKYFNSTITSRAVVSKTTTTSGLTIQNQPTPQPSTVPLASTGSSNTSAGSDDKMNYIIGISAAIGVLMIVAAGFLIAYIRLGQADASIATNQSGEIDAHGSKQNALTKTEIESKSLSDDL